jgi:integration host factor subunit beta
MIKSELIELLGERHELNPSGDAALIVNTILRAIAVALATGRRVEIRGFGAFIVSYRPPRAGRNPRTGRKVSVPSKHVPHFKPGKEMRERINDGAAKAVVRTR